MSGNKWSVIAAEMPGRIALHVKNRWNWLARQQISAEYRVRSASDVLEKQAVFELLPMDDGVFGPAFEAFRATMFG
jgi:hypothetical protein